MARSSTTLQKGQQPPGAGRKKGVPNKTGPLTLDLIKTLKEKGHDPAAEQVNIFLIAMNHAKELIKKKKTYGLMSALKIASDANAELLKYIYPTRKAIEGNDGDQLTVKTLIEFLKDDEEAG